MFHSIYSLEVLKNTHAMKSDVLNKFINHFLFMKGKYIMYRLIIDNSENGIAIMADDSGKFTAYVNGKHYNVSTYRPMGGNGRQLREDSQRTIRDLLPRARERYAEMEAAEKAGMEAMQLACMEAARKEATPAPKSFADALQDAFLQTLTEKAAGDLTEQVYPIVEKMLVDKFGLLPVVHEIRIPEREKVEVKGIMHQDFDTVVKILLDDRDGKDGVYMFGPAGTGKGYMAKQLAAALNVNYYYANCITDEVQLKGFIDANGRYHETEFYKAFTGGGVFLLDELDGSVPETLLALNEALANGYYPFPTGKAAVHPQFYCVAAGNTFGTGADNQYTGRYQLDAASLDRFGVIRIDYDNRIENAMAGGDSDLVSFAHDFRKATTAAGVSCLFTYRGLKRLRKFSGYMEKADAIRIGLTKGLPADDIRMVYNRLENSGNPWAAALKQLANM